MGFLFAYPSDFSSRHSHSLCISCQSSEMTSIKPPQTTISDFPYPSCTALHTHQTSFQSLSKLYERTPPTTPSPCPGDYTSWRGLQITFSLLCLSPLLILCPTSACLKKPLLYLMSLPGNFASWYTHSLALFCISFQSSLIAYLHFFTLAMNPPKTPSTRDAQWLHLTPDWHSRRQVSLSFLSFIPSLLVSLSLWQQPLVLQTLFQCYPFPVHSNSLGGIQLFSFLPVLLLSLSSQSIFFSFCSLPTHRDLYQRSHCYHPYLGSKEANDNQIEEHKPSNKTRY